MEGGPDHVTARGNDDDHGVERLLASCPDDVFRFLFEDSPSCYAVFTLLPPLAKHHVIRLLFVDEPVPASSVAKFVSAKAKGGPEHVDALRWLRDLRVWETSSRDSAGREGGAATVSLSAAFRAGLRPVVAGGGTAWIGNERKKGDAERVDPVELERWGIDQWEKVLHYMVQEGGARRGADAMVVSTLFEAGLLHGVPGAHDVTKLGFQFLLKPRREQLWHYLIEYLKQPVFSGAATQAAALSLLFRLSFSQVGEAYPAAALTELQQGMLAHLGKLGLLRRVDEWFYPTGLASLLMRAATDADEGGHVGYLIIETNFRVFAIDPTELQVALLGKFVELQYKFPNMVAGTLTRESVRAALFNGITAEQIARYLQSHVHPRMEPVPRTPWSPLPRAVSDQLFLWQMEMQRVSAHSGRLYSDFSNDADFKATLAFCVDAERSARDNAEKERGKAGDDEYSTVLLAADARNKRMVVTDAGHDMVKRWRDSQRTS